MTNTEQKMASAAEHGDILMAAICARALGLSYDHMDLTTRERARVDALTTEDAQAICDRS